MGIHAPVIRALLDAEKDVTFHRAALSKAQTRVRVLRRLAKKKGFTRSEVAKWKESVRADRERRRVVRSETAPRYYGPAPPVWKRPLRTTDLLAQMNQRVGKP